MSRPKLVTALDASGHLIACAHTKLQRMFPGVKVRRLEGFRSRDVRGQLQPVSSVNLVLFGPEPLLLQYGLLMHDMLTSIPRCGFKNIRGYRDSGWSRLKRGKTGTSVNFWWEIPEGGSTNEVKSAPLWIRSELHRLIELRRECEETAKRKFESARAISPEEAWEMRARMALNLMESLLETGSQGAQLREGSPMRKHLNTASLVVEGLRRIVSVEHTPAANVSRSMLRLVVDNSGPLIPPRSTDALNS